MYEQFLAAVIPIIAIVIVHEWVQYARVADVAAADALRECERDQEYNRVNSRDNGEV